MILNSYSQLSDRVNSPSTFKIGTRPLKGNMGIYFGLAYNEVEFWFDHDVDYTGLPLVSLKYYASDKLVARLGFQIYKTKETIKGTVDPVVDGSNINLRNNVNISGKYTFNPGLEYHFKSSNILDVYIGATFPLGWSSEEYVDDIRYSSGNYNYYTRTLKSYTLGYEGFVGLQAFIADLPLAFGFELGLASTSHLNNKYKHVAGSKVGTVTTNQIYYSTDKDAMGIKYKSLTSSDSKLQGNIRVTLTFFFNR
jgi:hypothetical protein